MARLRAAHFLYPSASQRSPVEAGEPQETRPPVLLSLSFKESPCHSSTSSPCSPSPCSLPPRWPRPNRSWACRFPRPTTAGLAGVVYWANQTKAELEKQYPGLTVIVKTAKDANEQANQIQDLSAVNKINALVILPQESAPLTRPVGNLQNKGRLHGGRRPRPDRPHRPERLRGRRQSGPGQGQRRVRRQDAGRQGQRRGAARHRHGDRQPAGGALSRASSRPSTPTSRFWTSSTPTGTATTASR